jgi:LuxR family transcriptional regulator, maltose regulon positive regulatory protein
VTDSRPVVVESNSGLLDALLESKTTVPPLRRGTVSRRPVIERTRGHGARVVAVTAAAGYGKSTMLAEWAALETRPYAWVSLEDVDDDPAALLTVLATACASFSPKSGAVIDDMRGFGASALGRSASLLAAALAIAPESFVIFLDDVHRVDSVMCQDALEVILHRVPEGSQIVLASRHGLPLVARLRAEGRVADVTHSDLGLDVEGARDVFRTAGVHVEDVDLAYLVDRCEGWPTGLFLCALVAREGGDALAVTGEDRYLADYLYRECLGRLPIRTQTFLQRAAVLDQFSAEACNAVLELDDARALLHEVESAHLFLVPLDRTRGWFRFHALFREFLLTELERAEGASAVEELNTRAAEWHERNGLRAASVEYLLRARRFDRAAETIAEISLPMYQSGQISTITRWHTTMGEQVVRAYPTLAILAAWTAILIGDTAGGERWSTILASIDASSLTEPDVALFESARAAADAAFAMANEPTFSPWRDQALHLWGSACVLQGDDVSAYAAFDEAIIVAEARGNWDSIILCEPELALAAIDAGAWADAAVHARRAVAAIDEHHMDGYPTTALALAVASRVALHDGDRSRADRLRARGMRARVGCTHLLPYLSVRVRLQLAKAHLTVGDRSAARHLLREIDDILRLRADVGVVGDHVAEFRRMLDTQPLGEGSVPLTPAELRLLPYLQTHLTIGEIGQRLFVSRNTVSSELGSIYRKLGVTTRGGAVDRAIEVGLLGE